MSILLKIDSTTNQATDSADFTVNYGQSLFLGNPKDWEIALIKMNFVNSIFNISTALGNNIFKYKNAAGVLKSITISDGTFSISEINAFVQDKVQANGDYVGGTSIFSLTPNYSTLRCKINILQGANTAVDLSTGSFYLLLGFSAAQVAAAITVSTEGANVANINNGLVSMDVKCSIATGSFDGYKPSTVIYTTGVEVSSGSTQNISVQNPIYLPLNLTDGYVYSLRMNITDQGGKAMYLNNEPVSYMLHIRKRK